MPSFELHIENTHFFFEAKKGKVIIEGHEYENELIYNKLSNDSRMITFWKGANGLLKEIGQFEFDRQCRLASPLWREWRGIPAFPLEVVIANFQTTQDDGFELALWGEVCFARNPQIEGIAFWTMRNIGLLEVVSMDGTPELRMSAAMHTHTPKEILHKLSFDPDPEVQFVVAGNSKTPIDDLIRLAENEFVRDEVLGNKATPQGVINKYVIDADKETRLEMAANTRHFEVADLLSQDSDSDVAEKALDNQWITVSQKMEWQERRAQRTI